MLYNAEDPAKRQYVENTISSQVQAANAALTKRIAKEAVSLLGLISDGGQYRFLGREVDVLGLEQLGRRSCARRGADLPPGRRCAREWTR